jgi:hypothetical protein
MGKEDMDQKQGCLRRNNEPMRVTCCLNSTAEVQQGWCFYFLRCLFSCLYSHNSQAQSASDFCVCSTRARSLYEEIGDNGARRCPLRFQQQTLRIGLTRAPPRITSFEECQFIHDLRTRFISHVVPVAKVQLHHVRLFTIKASVGLATTPIDPKWHTLVS